MGVSQIIVSSIEVLQAVKETMDRQKTSAPYLARVADDIANILKLINIISKETALQIEPILSGVRTLHECACLLQSFVKELEEKCKTMNILRKFTYHLAQAPTEQKKLVEMTSNLEQAKITLVGMLQVAKVGVEASEGKTVVNVVVVEQVDRQLHVYPGLEDGLRIAQLLKAIAIDKGKSKVQLHEADLALLDNPPPYERDSGARVPGANVARTSHVVVNNTAEDYAFMFNATIGDGTENPDAIIKPDHTRIENNVAKRGAFMFNANNSRNTFIASQQHYMNMAAISQGIPVSQLMTFNLGRPETKSER